MLRRAPKALLSVTAIAAAAALTLAGCSSKGETKPEEEEGPLMKYISVLWDNEEYTEERMQEDQVKRENFIAECMQAEGFEYTPDTRNFGGLMIEEEDEGPQWGTEEFAKQYGWGYMDSPMSPDSGEEPDYGPDPNEEYVNSLSESEMQAYQETLYGASPTEEEWAQMEEDGVEWQPDQSEMGCSGKVYEELYAESDGFGKAQQDPEFADLMEGIEALWNQEESDEVQKLNVDWAACMADSGYPDYQAPQDVQDAFMEEMNEFYSSGSEGSDGEYVEPSKQELDKMKEREIELATAEFTCKQKTGYDKKRIDIQFAAEQKFLDENKAELDAMIALYQVSSGSETKEK